MAASFWCELISAMDRYIAQEVVRVERRGFVEIVECGSSNKSGGGQGQGQRCGEICRE